MQRLAKAEVERLPTYMTFKSDFKTYLCAEGNDEDFFGLVNSKVNQYVSKTVIC